MENFILINDNSSWSKHVVDKMSNKELRSMIIDLKNKEGGYNIGLLKEYFRRIRSRVHKLVFGRFTKTELANTLANIIGCDNIKLVDIDTEFLVSDYAFICDVFEDIGYLDIYYLKPPVKNHILMITGIECFIE